MRVAHEQAPADALLQAPDMLRDAGLSKAELPPSDRTALQLVHDVIARKTSPVSSATAFNFTGAWFAAPNTNGATASWINVTAYDAADHVIGSTGNVAIGADYRWVGANFTNVARLNISRDDGWFVMDDFNVQSPVPEPGSVLMLLVGLCVLAYHTSKRGPSSAPSAVGMSMPIRYQKPTKTMLSSGQCKQ